MKTETAIVTGASSGIGEATAARLAGAGYKVYGTSRRGAQADQQPFRMLQLDVTSDDSVEAAVREVIRLEGRIDLLVNNAGWDMFKPFLKTDPAFWQKILSINLVGPMNLMHCVLPGMVERGRGKVVNIASDAGRVGSSGEAPYSACKGGIIALTKTLARELAGKGVRLNTVCPGLTETNMLTEFMKGAGNPEKLREAYRRAIPAGRLGKPEDLPGAILFFASDDADFITGQVLSVSGGLTMHG